MTDEELRPLPGPYRICEEDGCAYRAEHIREKYVLITDCFGGHSSEISFFEWESWPRLEGSR